MTLLRHPIAISAALIGTIGSISGCRTVEVPAAADVAALPLVIAHDREDAPYITPLIDREQEGLLREGFALAAAGATPRQPPARARNGRWSDMVLAVQLACDDAEMAVVSRDDLTDGPGHRFELSTINGRPGVLIVRRTFDRDVYAAEATIGLYADEAAARVLLDALRRNLRALGAKRGFEDEGTRDPQEPLSPAPPAPPTPRR